ncbi:PREDICTED: SH2 domain-containing protein 5 [Corvus brachyrhynchos]|uniref:SH2 domain-containing protein 5 n=1 Tax=Corvus brachyrhynchos TaxID=85066 RepID=UPI00081657F3|nr:PREDICTED: SH2 domain-containing protein 5 [Corvus brachyrhynchos]
MKKKPGNGRGPDPAAPQQRARSVTKPAEYVGSFTVEELDLQQRAGRLEEQLRTLKDCPRRRSVVLRFSLQGLKVYGADGEGSPREWPEPPDPSHGLSIPQDRRPEAEGRAWRPGNPYCSPVLVRKKAIRSKVLRSGAYRDCGGEGQLHQHPRDAGECRGWVRAPCGVVSYGLARTHQGRFCVEHSNTEFASVAALLAHYSGTRGGCFCRLAPGRHDPPSLARGSFPCVPQ